MDDNLKFALRYVTKRPARNGFRWYWQRKGHKLTRLPEDLGQRITMAYALNADADGATDIIIDSVEWVITKYRASDYFLKLKPHSVRVYSRWLNEIEAMWGKLPAAAITRRVVMEFRDSIESRSMRHHAMAVLNQVMRLAMDYGLITVNPAIKARVGGATARSQVWSDEQAQTLLKAADGGFWLGVQLLRYTGQRPSDVLAMTWPQYDGTDITLTQIKTGKNLILPCHSELRAILDNYDRKGVVMCLTARGTPFAEHGLAQKFIPLRKELGLEGLQLRDFRRTAAVKLAEAGCEIAEIAAITGHSIDRTTSILAVYLPTNRKMAANAIIKLEQHQKKGK